jgi:hypothetical protein
MIDKELAAMQREAVRADARVERVKEVECAMADLRRQLEEKKTAMKEVQGVRLVGLQGGVGSSKIVQNMP